MNSPRYAVSPIFIIDWPMAVYCHCLAPPGPLAKGAAWVDRGSRRNLTNNTVKLHRAEASALATFAGEAGVNLTWATSARRLVELGKSLRGGRCLTAITPARSFNGKLRPYQADGLAWLDFLRKACLAVLADDMGLGKTVQALAFLAREKEQERLTKPALIVCPTSVLPNWLSEAKQFTPKLAVLPLRGLDRATRSQLSRIAIS